MHDSKILEKGDMILSDFYTPTLSKMTVATEKKQFALRFRKGN